MSSSTACVSRCASRDLSGVDLDYDKISSSHDGEFGSLSFSTLYWTEDQEQIESVCRSNESSRPSRDEERRESLAAHLTHFSDSLPAVELSAVQNLREDNSNLEIDNISTASQHESCAEQCCHLSNDNKLLLCSGQSSRSISKKDCNDKVKAKLNHKERNKGRHRRGSKWRDYTLNSNFSYSMSERALRLMILDKDEAEAVDAEYWLFQSELNSADTSADVSDAFKSTSGTLFEPANDSLFNELVSVSVSNNNSDIVSSAIAEVTSDEVIPSAAVKNTSDRDDSHSNMPTENTISDTKNSLITVTQETNCEKEVAGSTSGNNNNTKDTSNCKLQPRHVRKRYRRRKHQKNDFELNDEEGSYDCLASYDDRFSLSRSLIQSIDRFLPKIERIIHGQKILRNKNKWHTMKAHNQVKDKYCSSIQNSAHGQTYYAHHRTVKRMTLQIRMCSAYYSRPFIRSIRSIDRERHISREVLREYKKNTDGGMPQEGANVKIYGSQAPRGLPARREPNQRHAITVKNADNDLPIDLVNILISLQERELSPEDYELLLRLDDRVKPKTFKKKQLSCLPTDVVNLDSGEALDENCSICCENYEVGQKRKHLPCGHRFHSDCIDNWLTCSSVNCPLDGVEVVL